MVPLAPGIQPTAASSIHSPARMERVLVPVQQRPLHSAPQLQGDRLLAQPRVTKIGDGCLRKLLVVGAGRRRFAEAWARAA
jgi:hypothetical protein